MFTYFVIAFLGVLSGSSDCQFQHFAGNLATKVSSGSIISSSHKQYVDSAPITMKQTEFVLYNKDNHKGTRIYPGNVTSVRTANYDPSKPTVLVVHGFVSSRTDPWQTRLRKAHLDTMDVNYIAVEWSSCARQPLYNIAVQCSYKVGNFIAELIKTLIEAGADTSDMHLIGHSLGAHAIAQVSNHGIIVEHMTGLDPTQVGFWERPNEERLDPSDARNVDIVHTNVHTFGWNKILGHTDIFVNGGDYQPNCFFGDAVCSHNVANDFYAEGLYDPNKYPTSKCKSVEEANKGSCKEPSESINTRSAQEPRGIFYVSTKNKK